MHQTQLSHSSGQQRPFLIGSDERPCAADAGGTVLISCAVLMGQITLQQPHSHPNTQLWVPAAAQHTQMQWQSHCLSTKSVWKTHNAKTPLSP